MSIEVDFQGIGVARANLKKVFDATDEGKSVTLARGGEIVVALPAERVRKYFAETIAMNLQVELSGGSTFLYSETLPFHSEGDSIESAKKDMVDLLREYAEDWEDHLYLAPNHADFWGLVQLVKLSTDAELLDWMEIA